MKKIVILTGAGISKESGIMTFRESGGLWENYKIEEVASPIAWENDPEMVLEFYNKRRTQMLSVEPNPAHYALAKLEEKFDVQIITQNIDDLHERGGSSNILHLHGEMKKCRSTIDETIVYDVDRCELKMGDVCEKGSQLRPHIVWFGEAVPMIIPAVEIASQADILIVIGTSLVVYPAASLIDYVPAHVPKYIIDPNAVETYRVQNLTVIKEKAGTGVPELVEKLLASDV